MKANKGNKDFQYRWAIVLAVFVGAVCVICIIACAMRIHQCWAEQRGKGDAAPKSGRTTAKRASAKKKTAKPKKLKKAS